MATKVLVPRLGEGVDEVIISRWLKNIGDHIQELEPLLEVNTDKVDSEIPAPVSGIVLSIAFQEGVAARVGDVLAVIGQTGESSESSINQPESRDFQAQPTSTSHTAEPLSHSSPSITKDLGFISPVVAKIASEYGVNLQQITGSGLGGRITKSDVLAFVKNDRSDKTEIIEPLKSETPFTSPHGPTVTAGDTVIKHSLMRKSIAEHMLVSKQMSPHVLTVMEVDLSRVVAHRSANKSTFAREGLNLTYTVYFMSAIVSGLKAYPNVNSSWSDEGLIVHAGVHLGMATSLGEAGLIVPVIRDADRLSLLGLAQAVNDLATRARTKKLHPDEVKGGTFTLTNHGVSGSLLAMPIINQPQCGILGVGAIQKRVVVITDTFGNDAIAIHPMVYLSFVFDHRILDGASADWFLVKVKETLEKWTE